MHRQIVNSIANSEDQLAGFTKLLEVVASSTCQLEGSTGGLSQSKELQPSLARVGQM